jgi:DNA-binding ferritin-like protein
MTEEKGLVDTLAEIFDDCAEAVEDITGKPAEKLRKGARVCRKAKKAAVSVQVAAVKMKRIQEKAHKSGAIDKVAKVAKRIKDAKIVTITPYE